MRGVRPGPVEDELAVAVGLEVERHRTEQSTPLRPPSRASTIRGTQPAASPTLPDASSAARNACSRKGSSSPARRSHSLAATAVTLSTISSSMMLEPSKETGSGRVRPAARAVGPALGVRSRCREEQVERCRGPGDVRDVLVFHRGGPDELHRRAEPPVLGDPELLPDHPLEPDPDVRLVRGLAVRVAGLEVHRRHRPGEVDVDGHEVVDERPLRTLRPRCRR